MASFSSQDIKKGGQPCFTEWELWQKETRWHAQSQTGSLWQRWVRFRVLPFLMTQLQDHSCFPKRKSCFTVMSLSCSSQMVIKGLDAWYLGHSKHYFSVIHFKGRGQSPHSGQDFNFFYCICAELVRTRLWYHYLQRDTTPPRKW